MIGLVQGNERGRRYIEAHLTDEMAHRTLAQMVGVSVHEFARIFAFMAGMSLSEYIRRRRLTQVAFDIQKGDKRVIDVALLYGYESQAAFARAFRELHGTPLSSAHKASTSLKTYPPISFILTVRGANGMNYRESRRGRVSNHGTFGLRKGRMRAGQGADAALGDVQQSYDARLWNNGNSF